MNTSEENLSVILLKHFEDDNQAFKKIDEQFKEMRKHDERFAEIIKQNGEHFSHMAKSMSEIHTTLSDHIVRVEPMLVKYEENTRFYASLTKRGAIMLKIAGAVGSTIGLFYLFKDFLNDVFLSLMHK